MAEGREKPASGLSLQTLVVSSVAAVVATVVVSQFWRQGTLVFTAMVPVVVAITSELLKRPAEKITAVAPKVVPPVIRRAPGGTEVREPEPELVSQPVPVPEPEPMPQPPAEPHEDPFGLREPERGSWLQDRRVRIGLITGLVAFLIGGAFITLSELTFGGSVGGGDRRTTLLGGSKSSAATDRKSERERTEPSGDEATATATPATDDPEATPTTEPSESATPTPSTTPSATPSATVAPEGGAQATPVP